MTVDTPTPACGEPTLAGPIEEACVQNLLAEAAQVLREAHAQCGEIHQTGDPEAVGHLLRSVHSYKSLMAFAGQQAQCSFAGQFEQYLKALWQKQLPLDREAQALVRQGLGALQDLHLAGCSDPPAPVTELMERFHVCLQTAVANPPALPIPPPSLGCTDVDHTAEAGSGFPALVEPEDLAELAQMSGNLNRLLHRLHELLPPDDERLEALVSAVLVTGEKLFQTIYRHRFASLRAFLLPAVGAVREMAASQGKLACARLEVTNADVDRQVLLSLRASLLHLLRNTVAHGIEDPETREACGKPRTGTIVISAAVRDGQLHQSVSDDGRGFDVGALRSAAVASGAVSPERAAATPDEHAMTYALIPGLSTRAEPDALSGNGVGLTVVAEEVYALGGTIELVSRPGQSSTVHLSVPLPSASA